MFVNLVCWAAIGLLAGFIASRFVNEHGDDPKLAIMLAAFGAIIGGFIFGKMNSSGIAEFNGSSLPRLGRDEQRRCSSGSRRGIERRAIGRAQDDRAARRLIAPTHYN